MNCLIADDHWIVRKGMISILENHFPELKFYQAASLEEIFAQLQKNQYGILILDFMYPDGALKNVIATIKQEALDAKIVVMSSAINYFDYLEINNQVNAVLSKQSSQAVIINCVQKVLDNCFVNQDEKHQAIVDKVNLLSDRELEIVKLIINGYGNKEMVNELGIKENTISTMRKRAFDKLEIDNNVALINLFMQSVL